MGWIEGLVFRYEFARRVQQNIVGLSWRIAWGYSASLRGEREDPIEAADEAVRKLRGRP